MLQPFELGEDLHLRISPVQLDKLVAKFPGIVTINVERNQIAITTVDKKLGTQHFEVPLVLVDEPVAGDDDMGHENWKCSMRTVVMDSGK